MPDTITYPEPHSIEMTGDNPKINGLDYAKQREARIAATRLLSDFMDNNPRVTKSRILPKYEVVERDGSTFLDISVEVI